MNQLIVNNSDLLRIRELKSLIEARNSATLKSIRERRDYMNSLKNAIAESYEKLKMQNN